MVSVLICDRCRLNINLSWWDGLEDKDVCINNKHYELCRECQKSFNKWLK